MKAMITSLRALGVDINDDGRGTLPFTVHGTGRVAGGRITIDASSSSQFVSGLLLSAARFDDGLHLTHEGERLPSLPHIEMTIAALARARSRLSNRLRPVNGWCPPARSGATDVDIEPDLSNAAPFLAAALVAGGSVTITGWPASTTQVGADLADILPLFGATVDLSGDRLTVSADGVRAGGIRAVTLDLTTGGELAPAIVALAALADGPSEITGIGHIRHHETDRLAALAAEINGLGGDVTELEDGLRDRAPARSTAECGAATTITGWPRPARSSGSPFPASRSRTSRRRRRRFPSSRSCGRRCSRKAQPR